MQFAPRAYRDTRVETAQQIEAALRSTANLTNLTPIVLWQNPSVLQILRMATAPPIARDRLIGLTGVLTNLVKSMEDNNRIPPRMLGANVDEDLQKIERVITQLLDRDILPWIENGQEPTEAEVHRATTIIADRLCGAVADPIVRNAQERRQLAMIKDWLEQRGYSCMQPGERLKFNEMRPGTKMVLLVGCSPPSSWM